MKVYMLWNGGSGYSPSDQFNKRDIEVFPSIGAAIAEFRERPHDPHYPGAYAIPHEDGGPEAWLCFDNPYQNPDLQPDRVLSFGKRGGVKCSLS